MKSITSFFFGIVSLFAFSQQDQLNNSQSNDLNPFFIGLIVQDVDSTAQWYVDNLGFEIYKMDEAPEYGVKAKFLKIDGFRIEMFQHKDAYNVDQYLPDDRIPMLKQGISKFGFLINDAERLQKDLKVKGVDIYREMFEDSKFGFKFFFVKDPAGNKIQIFEVLD